MKPKTVEDYIASYPVEVQLKLEEIRALIKECAPDAEEGLIYGMPGFRLNGYLIGYAAFKNHIGIYPTASPIVHFAEELAKYKTSKGAIQLPYGERIPKGLIKKMVAFKVKENVGRG